MGLVHRLGAIGASSRVKLLGICEDIETVGSVLCALVFVEMVINDFNLFVLIQLFIINKVICFITHVRQCIRMICKRFQDRIKIGTNWRNNRENTI